MGCIKEVKYPRWIINIVVERSQIKKVRDYIDFTYLCDASLPDSYPLTLINKLASRSTSYELLLLMDAFGEYNQS